MKPNEMLRGALLVLVAASVGAWAWKTWNAPDEQKFAAANVGAPAIPSDAVVVINFHGTLRCPTCLGIGSATESVVTEDFAALIEEGRVAWSSIDYDQPENQHFKDDYELVSSGVVVVKRAHGADVSWKRLDEVWELYDDVSALRETVRLAVVESLAVQR